MMKYKIGIFILGVMVGFGTLLFWRKDVLNKPGIRKTDKYEEYTGEVYKTIKDNYWQKISDQELAGLYKLAVEKLTGSLNPKEPQTLDQVISLVKKSTANLSDEDKENFVVELSKLVLNGLKPFARSNLLGKAEEDSLRKRVANIDTSKNLYQELGLKEDASAKQIDNVYAKQRVILQEKAKDSTEAAQKLKSLAYAHKVLSKPSSKQVYDKTGAEPTVFSKILSKKVFYVQLSKISPISFDEFKLALNSTDSKSQLNALILDLRGNVGGAVDSLPYFLGPFLGKGQYAYEFFHQGVSTPYKTRLGWLNSLVKFKKTVVLIDNKTQSSAEIMASALKKYNVGVLVGRPTRGWGTIENTFKLKSEIAKKRGLSVFLVHSLTLGDDGQPIEGNGIKPLVDVTKPNWKSELLDYIGSEEVVSAVADLVKE